MTVLKICENNHKILSDIHELIKNQHEIFMGTESRPYWRKLTICNKQNRSKIGPLEPEIQPAKSAQCHYPGTMTSRDVIGLQPVTKSHYHKE